MSTQIRDLYFFFWEMEWLCWLAFGFSNQNKNKNNNNNFNWLSKQKDKKKRQPLWPLRFFFSKSPLVFTMLAKKKNAWCLPNGKTGTVSPYIRPFKLTELEFVSHYVPALKAASQSGQLKRCIWTGPFCSLLNTLRARVRQANHVKTHGKMETLVRTNYSDCCIFH